MDEIKISDRTTILFVFKNKHGQDQEFDVSIRKNQLRISGLRELNIKPAASNLIYMTHGE